MNILELPPTDPGIRINYGRDANQFGELRLPSGKQPHPVVIFLHGGFWRCKYDLTHTGHLCVALTAAGFATWSLEYRRLGQLGGGWPGTLDDVRQGAGHLTTMAGQYELDLSRIVAVGHSAGGQLALWLAAQPGIQLIGVVALAAVSDLRLAWSLGLSDGVVAQFLGGTPEEFPDRYALCSPVELLPLRTPQRLVHGTKDEVVPFVMSERFVQMSSNGRLISLDGAGHHEVIDPRSEEWPVVMKNITEWDLVQK